ncbi:myosin tail region-interacting protein MTI1-like [Pseudomyrmex gracilis]|uniref:myosin tail region-interacting protein MTI1-like n=1 Tax=Pseudomyrmex gracilis TaxID=219809 RepID=UPI0009958D32|nr:myosin tail region-interacting protein MTI1-like [Pseudomyrmex gracilis]
MASNKTGSEQFRRQKATKSDPVLLFPPATLAGKNKKEDTAQSRAPLAPRAPRTPRTASSPSTAPAPPTGHTAVAPAAPPALPAGPSAPAPPAPAAPSAAAAPPAPTGPPEKQIHMLKKFGFENVKAFVADVYWNIIPYIYRDTFVGSPITFCAAQRQNQSSTISSSIM